MEEKHTEHKHHVEHKEEHAHHAKKHVKIKKSAIWMMISLILAILLVISITTGGFKGGQSKDSFIFMNSEACTTACDTMEPIAKELAQKAGLSFSKAKYFQPVEVPGYVLIKDGIISLSGIQDKASLVNALCDATGSDGVCSEAGKAQEEAEKEALKSAEEKCEAMEKVDKPKLEVFYVSRCPFGVQAINSLYYVAKNFGDEVEVIPRLLVDKAADGKSTTSMHGEAEHVEDLRHICLQKEQPDVYWDYINCYAETGDGAECEKTAKVDSDKLANCDGEKYALVEADDWSTVYRPKGGSGSPSFFLNGEKINEYEFSQNGRSPENVKNIICCSAEGDIAECDNKLATNNPPRGFGTLEGGTASDVAQATC